MTQRLHTEDLAHADVSGAPAGDDVMVAELADDEPRDPDMVDLRHGTAGTPTATAERPAMAERSAPGTPTSTGTGTAEGHWAGLGNTGDLRQQWEAIQAGFVDEPRRAVEQADSLVAEVIQRLAKSFADERTRLEGQWSRGDQVGTEDLRVALQRYRSFFQDLLAH